MSHPLIAMTLQALRRRLRRAAERLGAPGMIAVAILATCAGYYGGTVLPLEQQIESMRDAGASGTRPAQRRPEDKSGGPLLQFVAAFPEEREAASVLAQIYALGERAGVRLAQGEYRFIGPDALGMTQYKVMLPVSGRYPSIRKFVSSVLAEVPSIAVTQVNLQRERVGQQRIDARLELTLHLRVRAATIAGDAVATEPFSVAAEGAK